MKEIIQLCFILSSISLDHECGILFEKRIHYMFVNIPGFLICLGNEDKAMKTITHDMWYHEAFKAARE